MLDLIRKYGGNALPVVTNGRRVSQAELLEKVAQIVQNKIAKIQSSNNHISASWSLSVYSREASLLLRLFLVNDRIWVVARSKKVATEEVKQDLGLINVKISCIENSEVMENGMKASDMIALSDGKVKIIGRTE